MIKNSADMKTEIKKQMRGGNGQAIIKNVFDKGEYKGASRLIATIKLEPGCSIGPHVHENEEEIFYIIKGTASYNDNGKNVILNSGDSCICLSGQEHSVANESKDETLEIFAVILTY
ncbi:MAG: cupin domain-containing protein [Clostridia bacterium]|nr:cupin domain-containing protein [Clostridia bacterium]